LQDRDLFTASRHPGPKNLSKVVNRMGFVPVMWAFWFVSLLLLVAVRVYAARATRYEENQIFLGDAFSGAQAEQADIQAKVNKFQPIKRLTFGLLGLMTLVVVGYYILNIVNQFRS
jgi:hypothetical protein